MASQAKCRRKIKNRFYSGSVAATLGALAANALLWLAASAAAAANITIVENGRPAAVVVTADNPAPTAVYAAEELVSHVQKATGAVLPVAEESSVPGGYDTRIFVGVTEAARDRLGIDPRRLGPDAFVLRSLGDDLFVLGREHREVDPLSERPHTWGPHYSGTLFGVYELLERYAGVRWMWPGELGTHVPETATIVVSAVDETSAPALLWREMRWSRMRQAIRDQEFEADPLAFSSEGFENYANDLRAYLRRHRMGWTIPRPVVGHYFQDWWNLHGEENPEWFMMDEEGNRGPFGPRAHPLRVAMCVSNPDLHRYIVEEAWGGGGVLRLGEVDGREYCRCPDCMSWDGPQPEDAPFHITSDRYARFWATIHEMASKRNPNVTVTAYLYFNYFPAPLTDIELNENIHVEFVPWGTPEADWFPMPEETFEWLKDQWLGWKETGVTMMYRPNYLLDGYVMPHVNMRQAGEFFKFAFENGLVGVDFDSLTGQWAVHGPKLYLHMRLSANPRLEVEDILDEYYEIFGPAAEDVRAYFDYWEQYAIENMNYINEIYEGISRHSGFQRKAHKAFPPESFYPAERLLSAAADSAGGNPNPVYLERVKFLKLGLEHAQIAGRLASYFDGDFNIPVGTERFNNAVETLDELIRFRREHEALYISDYLSRAHHARRFWNIRALMQFVERRAGDERQINIHRSFALPEEGWKFRLDDEGIGRERGWFETDHDDSNWADISIGKAWQEFGYDYIGTAWYRSTFEMPEKIESDAVEIYFYGVDESAWVWINGHYAGEHDIGPAGWNVPFTLDITDIVQWGRENHITVMVKNTAYAGGIWQPATIFALSYVFE